MPGPENRRRSPRYPAQGEATLASALRANLMDIAANGLRLAPFQGGSPATGAACSVHVDLDSEPPLALDCRGRVVWVERLGGHRELGLEFVDLSTEQERCLRRMLDLVENAPPPGEPLEGVHVELSPDPAESPEAP